MIQEIIALVIFGSAVFYGFFQLGKFLIPVKKQNPKSCGSDSCGCNH